MLVFQRSVAMLMFVMLSQVEPNAEALKHSGNDAGTRLEADHQLILGRRATRRGHWSSLRCFQGGSPWANLAYAALLAKEGITVNAAGMKCST